MEKTPPIPGVVYQMKSGIRRLTAPNPGFMTGPGTNTYIFGEKKIAILDPGPDIDEHIEQILELTKGNIFWILATHTHLDHSPGVLSLAKATGAEVLGISPPHDGYQDMTFSPDRELKEGDLLSTKEFELKAIHTPGHASNHLCYLHNQHQWLFTGDHIMDGSTVVINPPDGKMSDYLNSMMKLKQRSINAIAPGHGSIIKNPREVIEWIIRHRLEREKIVLESVKQNPKINLKNLVAIVYADVDKYLHPLAERSLLAHLLKLQEDDLVKLKGDQWELTP